jgi:peptidoglycan/LPS O-acetylase OafA/YrhL
MLRVHPVTACAALLYIAAIVTATLVLPDGPDGNPPSPWWSIPVFFVLGVLLAILSVPRRWWVALGFAWLGAAWVEAAQAVWLTQSSRARIEDLLLGCVGGAIGVSVVVVTRLLVARKAASRRALPAAISAAAGAPRSR